MFVVGSAKPVWKINIDVESILAKCVAIKLKHFCELTEIRRKRLQFEKDFPRKRLMHSMYSNEGPPAKRKCKK